MYDPENFSERRVIYSAPISDSKRSREVGCAFRNGSDSHFEMKLNIFPRTWFFLVPNLRLGPEYRVYSGMWTKANGKIRFGRDVGSGNLSHDGHYIVLEFPDLNQCFYMPVDPTDIHYWANQSAA